MLKKIRNYLVALLCSVFMLMLVLAVVTPAMLVLMLFNPMLFVYSSNSTLQHLAGKIKEGIESNTETK